MSQPTTCPRCGAPLAVDGDANACAACLLRSAFPSSIAAASDERAAAPTLAELAPHFPQLEFEAAVGRGAMGSVYRARQRSLDRPVALKVLARELCDRPGFRERFEREARALATLHHPGIVAVHDAGIAGPYPYLLMEYVDGASLRDVLREGALGSHEVLALVTQLCTALEYAHARGVVHRDVKPENVLLDREGRVKIADFGLAKLAGAGAEGLTRATQIMGTPPYMAPEQYERPAEVDHRADLYALGVMLYELLTGELPLGRFDAPSQRANIDARLDAIVLKALERDRERRYQRAKELETDLAAPPGAADAPMVAAKSSIPATADADHAPSRPEPPASPSPILAVFALCALSMLVRYLPLSNAVAKSAWIAFLCIAVPLLLSRPFVLRGTRRGALYGFSLCCLLAAIVGAFALDPSSALSTMYSALGDSPASADALFVRVVSGLAALAAWTLAWRLRRRTPAMRGVDRLVDGLIVLGPILGVGSLSDESAFSRGWFYEVCALIFFSALWAEMAMVRIDASLRVQRGALEIGSAAHGASAAVELLERGSAPKLHLIKALRKATGAGLADTLHAVEHLPAWIALRIEPKRADALKAELEALGARARVERPGPLHPPAG